VVLLDFHTLRLTSRPNQYLVLPRGYEAQAQAHRTSPVYPLPPDRLLDAVARVALAEPRTKLVREDRALRQLDFIQRSRLFRFPDTITVEAVAAPGGSALAIYSRATYGIRDFGVNRARIERWLAALPPARAA
jgi:uncharacterized protein (DUF1499 family)